MKTIIRLLRYMSDHTLRLVVVFACMIIGSVCSVRATYYLKPLINDCLVPLIGQGSPDYSEAIKIFTLMAVLYAVSVAAIIIQGFIMVHISNDVMYRVRSDMFSVMERLPLGYFNNNSTGKIMSYYTADVDALSNMLRQSFPRIVEGIAAIITILVTILMTDLRMSGVVIGCVAVIALILRLLAGNKSRYFSLQQSTMQDLNSYGEEMLSGRTEVKAFSREQQVADEYAGINAKLRDSMSKVDFFSNSMFDFSSGLSYVGYTAVAVIGCLLMLSGHTDAGTVGIFLQYYRKLLAPVTRIAKQVNNVFSARAGAERIFDFIDMEAEPDDGEVTLVSCTENPDGSLTVSDGRTGRFAWAKPDGTLVPCLGRIEFSHVDFGYEPEAPLVLHDLSLAAEPGQTIAIVGTTGAGKTTVVNLLSRFYEIADGTITFDGINVLDIRKDDLRRAAGAVLQETHLFSMPVRENIRFGRLDADDEDIKKAAELSNADRFIELLSEGYDTELVHGGSSLSQGQRQLLSIARAAVGEFPVLVLDEATSSIDSRTELLVARGLDALMQNKTVIVIAHRLSTIRNADKIIVLDKGRIAESGTHDELIEQKGIYYGLYSSTTMA